MTKLASALLASVSILAAVPALAQEAVPQVNDSYFKQAQAEMEKIAARQPNTGKAKNVILFVGDGMSISTVTAARIFDGQKKKAKAKLDTELTAEDLQQVITGYQKLVQKKTGKPFPQDAMDQLQGARDAVFRSWMNPRAIEYRRIYDIPDHIGTAVNVQMMVFGNTGDRSGTGVGFTRNPATGAKEFYGEFLINAQGEDVVSGVRTPQPIRELEQVMPKAYAQLRQITTRLEKHYKDVQDFEFTIQDERLFMLQTRSGKRTGYAAVVIATDLVAEKLITTKDAVLLVDPESLNQLLAPGFDPVEWKKLPVATSGLPASPGAASVTWPRAIGLSSVGERFATRSPSGLHEVLHCTLMYMSLRGAPGSPEE